MSDFTDGDPASEAAEPTLAGFGPPVVAASGPTGYRVLARKYRPQTFAHLIGQDAMVRTVRNAFAANRIPQAWMLTGVRGVGKTTTARILARALNYDTGAAGAGPSIEMPELGLHCTSIIESRHVDVMEMDAASHTGIDNIRQITDAVRYGPVQARYKVYIIDEVHMLSNQAFNAFLKTLEEPPPHAKFVFATTEIRKVPVTILSRCQRFDLRRVDGETLVRHLARICEAEGVEVDDGSLPMLARAAEGSVRDALSLLDQAVAHGAGRISEAGLRDMLGLAGRTQVVDLFEAVMRGDVPAAFATLRAAHEAGADPRQMLEDLAEFTHLVTRIKLAPETASDPGLTEIERVRGTAFAAALPVRVLSRAWQILLKAVAEVGGAQRPLAAAEMALVRLAYAADLPTPDEVLRRLRREDESAPARLEGGGREGQVRSESGGLRPLPSGRSLSGPGPAPEGPEPLRVSGPAGPGPRAQAASLPEAAVPDARRSPDAETRPILLRRFEDVVAMAGERREIVLKAALERHVRPVRMEDGRIEIALESGAPSSLPGDLSRALGEWTGRRWIVVVVTDAGGASTIAEDRRRREDERRAGAETHPLVQAVLRSFPGAEIVDVRDRAADADLAAEAPALALSADGDVPPAPEGDEDAFEDDR